MLVTVCLLGRQVVTEGFAGISAEERALTYKNIL